jgi:hypothetical protein
MTDDFLKAEAPTILVQVACRQVWNVIAQRRNEKHEMSLDFFRNEMSL